MMDIFSGIMFKHSACFHRKLKNFIYRLIPFKVPVETEANRIIGDRKTVYHNHLLEVVIAVLIHLKFVWKHTKP